MGSLVKPIVIPYRLVPHRPK